MPEFWKCSIGLIVVLCIAVQIEAVTVNPLCPTNKIAPHRRAKRFENGQPRTFHAYYDLLRPDGSYDAPSSLQETPQEDDPADCGEIEDYDENDVSSVSTQPTRKQGHNYNTKYGYPPWIFNNFYGTFTRPTKRPRPTRPPTGGYFGTNPYNPPKPLKPTAHLKPVHEDGHEPHMMYRPGLVGAPSGHIVGLPQVKPTRHYTETTTHKKQHVIHKHDTTTQTNKQSLQKNPNRPPGLVGSFIDLLF